MYIDNLELYTKFSILLIFIPIFIASVCGTLANFILSMFNIQEQSFSLIIKVFIFIIYFSFLSKKILYIFNDLFLKSFYG